MPGAEVAGGMKVAFKRGGAFVVRAEKCQHHEIENLLEVEDAIASLDRSADGWRSRRWIVVTQMVTAQPAVVLIARNAGAQATVEVRVAAGQPVLAKLAEVGGTLRWCTSLRCTATC